MLCSHSSSGGTFSPGFEVGSGFRLKAEDNTIVEDLDGDGTEEIFSYEFNVMDVTEEQREYKFYILQDGVIVFVLVLDV